MIANDPIEHLITMLSRLPGLGRRSARRAVLKMLMDPSDKMLPLADALRAAADAVRPCEVCGNLDAASPCHICSDRHRDHKHVCVVEGVADLWALERAHVHRGTYHVLGGLLSALGGTGPEDLSITPLLRRIEADGIEEVIVALPATAKGNELSRITVALSGPVTTARSEVDVIVTEFGAAELKGQTLAERTRRLIAIAHPDFREELERAAHTIQQRGF